MPENFTLTLTQDQINVIGAALGELPFKHAALVVQEINRQLAAQIADRQTSQSPGYVE